MQTKTQPLLNNDELLDNIQYINQLNKEEISRVNGQIRLQVAEKDSSGKTTDLIIEEISSQLGQLSARVNLAEQAIRSIRQESMRSASASVATVEPVSDGGNMHYGVGHLVSNKNTLPIETNENGVDYVWTAADPATLFTFALNRRKKLAMQIRLASLIKPEYPNQLKVFIDGTHIKHSLGMDDGLFVVSCNLPSSSTDEKTEIKIVLPDTHKPKDLGDSGDGRELGAAITEIRFGKPVSRFGSLLGILKPGS